jgi:drug/metabolite transporter (DMT)-like permease
MKIQPVHWALLLALVAQWGSSSLMVEVVLSGGSPVQITGLRTLSAALVLIFAIIGNCLP